ncbi:hypothetical protein ACIOD2_49460 [Amycolatopsis sp. NPDC088138]|uniref:hypothetical protein n=1 Tax=Amycolatopsis sp. NPDC088138 TaxID=3363938 RepID=UPI0038138F00
MLYDILTLRQPDDPRITEVHQEAALQLVAICGALPLAVEVTASILANDLALTIGKLLSELIAAEGEGVHHAHHAEKSLTTVFDVSWRRLQARAPEAATLLPLLTLNPGPDFHNYTVAAIAGVPEPRVAPSFACYARRACCGRWGHGVVAA